MDTIHSGIQIKLYTKDGLVITASRRTYGGVVYDDFGVYPADPNDLRTKHSFDIDNCRDPGFLAVDKLLTELLNDNVTRLTVPLKELGIELAECKTDPME